MKTVEWTDERGELHVLVLDAALSFDTDPLPGPHVYDPMVRRFIGHPAQIGPECLGCLPYRFPEDHPVHVQPLDRKRG